MKVAWDLENVMVVQAPCWMVWRHMCDVLHWPAAGQRIMRPQADEQSFGYTLKPLGLPVRVKARITAARDMQLLAWQGRFWGINSEVKVRFVVEGVNATRIIFKENLSGLGLILFSALFSMAKLSKLNQNWLGAIAQDIEQNANAHLSCLPGAQG